MRAGREPVRPFRGREAAPQGRAGAQHANAADRSADLPLPCLCGASYTDWQQELMESNEPRPGSGIRKPQLDVDPAMPADPNNVVCFGGQVRGMTTWSWKTRRASIASNHLVRCGRTPLRSDKRRVGKGLFLTCRSRWLPYI